MNFKKLLLSLFVSLSLAVCVRATVPSSTAWLQYVCPASPSTTPLPVSFVFQNTTDLIVYDSRSSPPLVLVQNSDYTVQGGGGSTGTITISTSGINGVLVGDTITIARNMPLTQTTTFSATGPFNPTIVMNALDKLTMIVQQEQFQINSALQFQPDELRNGVMALAARENMSPAFDAFGNLIWVTPGSGGGGGGSGNSQTVTQANSFVAGEPITVNGSGVWIPATANSSLTAANAIGIVSSTGLSSTGFTVVQNGPCTVSTGSFTPSTIYYVPLTAGIVTSTAPSSVGQYVYPVATAISSTVVMVGISSPSQVIASLTAGAYSVTGNATSSSGTPSALQNGIILGTPNYTDTGVGIQQTMSVAGYAQWILQNTSNNNAASADVIVGNDQNTALLHYGDFGINSSTFAGTGSLAIAGATYLYSQNGDLVLGTNTANAIHFVINNGAADSVEINSSGILSTTGGIVVGQILGGSTNDAIANYAPVAGNGGTAYRGQNTYTYSNNNQPEFGLTLSPTLVMGSFTGDTYNEELLATPTITSGTLASGYMLSIQAPATGMTGALNIMSGAVNLGSGTTTVATLNATGAVTVGTTNGYLALTGGSGTSTAATIWQAGSQLQFNGGTSGYSWNNSGNTVDLMSLTNAGNLSVTGTITSSGGATSYYMGANLFAGFSASNTNIYCGSSGLNVYNGSGTTPLFQVVSSTGAVGVINGGNFSVAGTSTLTGNVTQTAKTTTYNNVATAGIGTETVYSAPRSTAVTNSTTSLAAYTTPAVDSSYDISANVNVTATTAAAMTVTCTYTDETNTSRTLTLGFTQLLGSTIITSITNVTGTGPYESLHYHIRCKASSTITFATAGTVTGITYNIEATAAQLL